VNPLIALVQLFAPMMPHLAEECWQALGQSGMVCERDWPEHDASLLVSDSVTVVVQINGKKRAEMSLAKGLDKRLSSRHALQMKMWYVA
jgi:leucyl-tRNA synthetase